MRFWRRTPGCRVRPTVRGPRPSYPEARPQRLAALRGGSATEPRPGEEGSAEPGSQNGQQIQAAAAEVARRFTRIEKSESLTLLGQRMGGVTTADRVFSPCSRCSWPGPSTAQVGSTRKSTMAADAAYKHGRAVRLVSRRGRDHAATFRTSPSPSPRYPRKTTTVALSVVASRSPQCCSPLALGLSPLALPFHRGLLVIDSSLHLLEDARLQHLLLESLESGLDLIAEDLDAYRLDRPASSGSPSAFG
jgi:hypothetical protein